MVSGARSFSVQWNSPDKVESGFLDFAKERIHDREGHEWSWAPETIH
jgi:hypothetical protein